MCERESCRDRQHNELEALKGIFGEQLRVSKKNKSKKKWYPLEVTISLTPQQSGPSKVYSQIDLHVICSEDYPDISPQIELTNSQGLSNQQVGVLKDELNDLMRSKKGDEVIYELCLLVQEFLHKNNKPSYSSLYESMIQRRQKEEEHKLQKRKNEEDKQRQVLQEEIQKRQEALKAELRNMRESSRMDNETSPQSIPSSPLERFRSYSKRRSASLYETYDCNCFEHKDKVLLFENNKQERQINRLRCLGHSKKGPVVFLGVDLSTGEQFAVTEWNLRCDDEDKEKTQVLLKQIASIEQEMNHLYKLYHRNLVHYLNMSYSHEKTHLTIHILQEFIISTTCSTMLEERVALELDRIRNIARETLSALQFLHMNNVVHKDLRDSSIHMTRTGVIKVSDYSIDKRLSDMYRASHSTDNKCQIVEDDFPTIQSRGGKKFDVYRLGIVLLSLFKGYIVTEQCANLDINIQPVFRDFLSKCLIKEERSRWSVNQLMEHNFIRTPIDQGLTLPRLNCQQEQFNEESVRPEMDVHLFLPSTTGQSRLQTEFQVLKRLGKGAFGDVLKVRNMLDDHFYAIKRIKLNPKKKQINRKITREVKLLSKLNHENVVRYYCSWIESTTIDTSMQDSKQLLGSSFSESTEISERLDSDGVAPVEEAKIKNEKKGHSLPEVEWNVSYKSKAGSALMSDYEEEKSSSDSDSDEEWPYMPRGRSKSEDSSSSNIQFECSSDADNQNNNNDDDSFSKDEEETTNNIREIQFMYIQMEFCEKSTLRTAIDVGLYKDTDRMWRLFREIVEGLAHIHQQGMIHRDLKPVNIFIDSNDHVKIGDFGLATTNVRSTLVPASTNAVPESSLVPKGLSAYLGDQGSMTGQVGTLLYAAPELDSKVEKAIYNQKVDIYSLGIILFEMSYGPLNTGMERVQVLINLRKPEIEWPSELEETMPNVACLLKWLLNHDPSQRPTAQEMLTSEYLPQQEEAEFNERIRLILSKKQSKQYRYLMECCFAQQETTPAEDYIYDQTIPPHPNQPLSTVKYSLHKKVRSAIKQVFKQHGGCDIVTPLLMPKSSHTEKLPESSVQVMTKSGNIVFLPYDLRTCLARYVVWKNIHRIRRYVIDRVYRERSAYGIHPRELYECAFDIISPGPQNLLQEAELIYMVWDICNKIPLLRERNFIVRLNHTSLLQAVLMYCGIEQDKHRDIYTILCDARDGKFSKFQVQTHLTSLCLTDQAMDILFSLFDTECHAEKITNVLRTITKRKGDASSIAKESLACIEEVITLAEELGVKWPMTIAPLMVQNVQQYSGVIYQISCESTRKHKRTRAGRDVVAAGGRYNKLLKSFSNAAAVTANLQSKRNGVGVSISLDKLIYAIEKSAQEIDEFSSADVVAPMPVLTCRPPVDSDVIVCEETCSTRRKEYVNVLKELWNLNLQINCSQFSNINETLEYCAENRIKYVIILKNDESGTVKVYCEVKDNYQERKMNIQELADYMQRQVENLQPPTIHRSESKSSTNNEVIFVPNAPLNANVNFFLPDQDKLSGSSRRSLKNTILAQMESTLQRVSNKLPFEIFAVALEHSVIKAISVSLKIDEEEQEFQRSIQSIIDEYPRHKKYIKDFCEEMRDMRSDKVKPILVLYSQTDNRYTMII